MYVVPGGEALRADAAQTCIDNDSRVPFPQNDVLPLAQVL
jgi:hypothetical protein